jgi:hypothetical protein
MAPSYTGVRDRFRRKYGLEEKVAHTASGLEQSQLVVLATTEGDGHHLGVREELYSEEANGLWFGVLSGSNDHEEASKCRRQFQC